MTKIFSPLVGFNFVVLTLLFSTTFSNYTPCRRHSRGIAYTRDNVANATATFLYYLSNPHVPLLLRSSRLASHRTVIQQSCLLFSNSRLKLPTLSFSFRNFPPVLLLLVLLQNAREDILRLKEKNWNLE